MSLRGPHLLIALGLGSVVVVAATLAYIAPGRRPEPAAAKATGDEAVIAQGVRPESYDPARREPLGREAAEPAGVARGEAPPSPPPPEHERRERGEPPPPGPPVVADAGLHALSEASVAAQPKAVAEVAAALKAKHTALRNACWPGGQDRVEFGVQASFGPGGELLTLSVPGNRAMPDVTACLNSQLAAAALALATPPGVKVDVALDITFP